MTGERTFNWLKFVGAMLIFAAVPTCMAASGPHSTAMDIGGTMAFFGFALFIFGRFFD